MGELCLESCGGSCVGRLYGGSCGGVLCVGSYVGELHVGGTVQGEPCRGTVWGAGGELWVGLCGELGGIVGGTVLEAGGNCGWDGVRRLWGELVGAVRGELCGWWGCMQWSCMCAGLCGGTAWEAVCGKLCGLLGELCA